MSPLEAIAVLAEAAYRPGESNTAGMPDELRRRIKLACLVLANTNVQIPPADPTPTLPRRRKKA